MAKKSRRRIEFWRNKDNTFDYHLIAANGTDILYHTNQHFERWAGVATNIKAIGNMFAIQTIAVKKDHVLIGLERIPIIEIKMPIRKRK